jgi:PadR family transcriptional regulator
VSESLGELEQLVLLALLRLGEEETFGVAVQQEIERCAGRAVTLGAVYTALVRLEGKGMVASHVGAPTPQRGGRRKKLYRVLPHGRRTLARAVTAIRELSRGLATSFKLS